MAHRVSEVGTRRSGFPTFIASLALQNRAPTCPETAMKRLIPITCSLAIPALASADLHRSESVETGPFGERSVIEWKRDGRSLLSQIAPKALDSDGLCMIRIGTSKKPDVVLYIIKGRASSISTKSTGFLISLDDFTRDGNPDFLQIIDGETS
jgi:hypothetical protein